MAVVVFLVGAAAGELDGLLLAPGYQALVDELPSVVAVYAQKGERERARNVRPALQNPLVGLV
jgi:hypothetical protein